MRKEQKSSGEQFFEISQQMTKAWEEMMRRGQYLAYRGIGTDRLEKLRDGEKPKKGEEHIAEYLSAVGKLEALSKTQK